MRIHYLVEGESEAAFLKPWLKRALPGHQHKIYPHKGKGALPRDLLEKPDPIRRGLLDQLPATLRAFGRTHDPATDRTLVLVDADQDDCRALKASLIALLETCRPAPRAIFRIAVEETEAFYLGDEPAIRAAFPKFKKAVHRAYEQDSICGTWEVFRDVVGWRHEAKVKWATMMAPHLGIATSGSALNRSPSFVSFYRAVHALAEEPWP